MKKFNTNGYIYIQITERGWEYLKETVGEGYIEYCINTDTYRKNIKGEVWHRLQAHSVFELLPIMYGGHPLYNTNIMIDDEALT